jgi:hypothetical protein
VATGPTVEGAEFAIRANKQKKEQMLITLLKDLIFVVLFT